jgi:S1-C subfamily serine protease
MQAISRSPLHYTLRLWLIALLAVLVLVALPTSLLAAPCTYTVRSGDTLGRIAARNGITVTAILAANPAISNPNVIRVGQQLYLPNCVAPGTPAQPAPPAPPVPTPPVVSIPAPIPAPLPVITAPQPVPAAPADLQVDLWQRTHDATINIRYPIGAPVYSGSGIVIGNDGRTFLTAYHVIGNALTGTSVSRVAIGPFANWSYTADVIATDPGLDLAVLRVREPDFPGFAVAPLGRSAALGPQSPIYTLSYPGLGGSLVAGKGHYLTQIRSFHNRSSLIMTDAIADFGSSGGVAVNARGEVIGIITGGIIGREAIQNVGFTGLDQATLLVPIDAATDLLRRAGVVRN